MEPFGSLRSRSGGSTTAAPSTLLPVAGRAPFAASQPSRSSASGELMSAGKASPKLEAIAPLKLRELLFWQVLWPTLRLRLANRLSPDPPVLEFLPAVALSLTSNPGHLAIWYCGFLELTLSRRMARLAAKGGLLVDVGANHGYFTSLWAAARPRTIR